MTEVDRITVDDLPEKIRTYRSELFVLPTEDPTELLSMGEVEKRYVLRVLQAVGGNKTLAAGILQFDRKTLYRKLQGYGIT